MSYVFFGHVFYIHHWLMSLGLMCILVSCRQESSESSQLHNQPDASVPDTPTEETIVEDMHGASTETVIQHKPQRPCELQEGGCARRYGCFLDLPIESISMVFIKPFFDSAHSNKDDTSVDKTWKTDHIEFSFHEDDYPFLLSLSPYDHVTIDFTDVLKESEELSVIKDISTIKMQWHLIYSESDTQAVPIVNASSAESSTIVPKKEEDGFIEVKSISPPPLFESIELIINGRQTYYLPWQSFHITSEPVSAVLADQSSTLVSGDTEITPTKWLVKIAPHLNAELIESFKLSNRSNVSVEPAESLNIFKSFYSTRFSFEDSCRQGRQYLQHLNSLIQVDQLSSKSQPNLQEHTQKVD
ncbi:MAG: hypothetical protein OXC44_05595 [Proteobacteria bacterium]|nr:hypothetical protein [Pseudomonadota bacterium]